MKKVDHKKFSGYDETTPSSEGVLDYPETSFEMVNKYGTYEIQPTCDTANYFPEIAQGLPTQPTGRNQRRDDTKSKRRDNGELWK